MSWMAGVLTPPADPTTAAARTDADGRPAHASRFAEPGHVLAAPTPVAPLDVNIRCASARVMLAQVPLDPESL